MAADPTRSYPSELPVLPLRHTVAFPLSLQPLAVNRPLSIDSVNRALTGDRLLFLTLQKDDKDDPEGADLHAIGTIGAVRQMAKVPSGGGVHIIVEGVQRAKAEIFTKSQLSLNATVQLLPENTERSVEVDAYVR